VRSKSDQNWSISMAFVFHHDNNRPHLWQLHKNWELSWEVLMQLPYSGWPCTGTYRYAVLYGGYIKTSQPSSFIFSESFASIASVVEIRINRAWQKQLVVNDSLPISPDTRHYFLWRHPSFAIVCALLCFDHNLFRTLLSYVFYFLSPLSIFSEIAQFCFVLAAIRKICIKFFSPSNYVTLKWISLCIQLYAMPQNGFIINV